MIAPPLRQLLRVAILIALAFTAQASPSEPRTWEIPLAGNTHVLRHAEESDRAVVRSEDIAWSHADTRLAVFFRVNQAAELDLALRVRIPEGTSRVHLVVGRTRHVRNILGTREPAAFQRVDFGRVRADREGYVRVELHREGRGREIVTEATHLVVTSRQPDLRLNFVPSGENERFYWGRRGPSVHLSYATPPGKDIEWFYNEVTVPAGQDTIGSFFMANGFGEGYFGIQVNDTNRRTVLFSIWSPFQTDDPAAIPEDQRVRALARGRDVRTGEFGNEGSGGQSALTFPWVAGRTYQFLNRVRPDGRGNTIYTAWFRGPETGGWRLIASFLRPKTDKHLTGPHSFLENFSTDTAHIGRRADYGNQWARDTNGEWHELTRARFTGDPSGDRLDFAGGVSPSAPDRFFLRNCGFFDEHVPHGSIFERRPSPRAKPDIRLESLEGFLP